MNRKIHVLIVEDDFRVAEINRRLVEQVNGYVVDGIAKTGDEAIAFLENSSPKPDLILLDIFLPDRNGLELFHEIRNGFPGVDLVMLTAATETATIKETVQEGIFDYVLKPVDFSRFEQSLNRYLEREELFAAKDEMDQQDIDRLIVLQHNKLNVGVQSEDDLPKGIDPLTLTGIIDFLASAPAAGVTAMEAAKAVGVSRSTARRYLEFLVSTGEAKARLNYGEIGRPERRYILRTK